MSAVIELPEVTRPATDSSPAGLLAIAVQRGADPVQLGQLLDLKERYDREEARKAYAEAMMAVQAEAPVIAKDALNKQTASQYAKLEAINAGLVPVYTRHGLSLSFSQGEAAKPEHIRIECQVSHRLGHVENKHVDLPLDMTGIAGTVNKTAIHATGSTYSYGRRYLTCMIFNVSTGDDDDGQSAGTGELEALQANYAALLKHNELVRDWIETIYVMKVSIRDGQLERAIEAACEMDDATRVNLNIAPTKGGIFTTAERTTLKSDEWSRLKRIFLGQPELVVK
jgi:hypothetical protein